MAVFQDSLFFIWSFRYGWLLNDLVSGPVSIESETDVVSTCTFKPLLLLLWHFNETTPIPPFLHSSSFDLFWDSHYTGMQLPSWKPPLEKLDLAEQCLRHCFVLTHHPWSLSQKRVLHLECSGEQTSRSETVRLKTWAYKDGFLLKNWLGLYLYLWSFLVSFMEAVIK